MERRTEPAARNPRGLRAQIQLDIAPRQPTAPQEVRSQLIDPATGAEIGHISITIDEYTLEQGPMHRPAIINANLDKGHQRKGLSPYLVYNLCKYLIDRYNDQFPGSAEQYSRATHICVDGDASEGYWEAMGGKPDYHPQCALVLTVGEMLDWATEKLRKAADRKAGASKMRKATRVTQHRRSAYGGKRKRRTKTSRRRRRTRRPNPRR
jgi:hypothetical protein